MRFVTTAGPAIALLLATSTSSLLARPHNAGAPNQAMIALCRKRRTLVQLEGKIQERYGKTKDEARKEVEAWKDQQSW